MSRPPVDAIIVTHDSARHLATCLDAVRAQTVPVRALVVDSGSSDGGPARVRAESPEVEVMELGRNAGYGQANDVGIAATSGARVLLLNPDCRLAPDYVERALAALEAAPDLAGVQGKLLKGTAQPPIIDSTGIVLSRARRNFDRGEGEPDRGQHDAPGEVFGVSGAAALFRREALRDVAVAGQVFDPTYWMYREDVDLCWRARLLGWRFAYEPRAVAWHGRGFGRADRSRVPRALRHASLRNRYLTILKNDDARALLRALPWLLPFELAQLAHVALREPALLLAYAGVLRRMPAALEARRAVAPRRRPLGPWLE